MTNYCPECGSSNTEEFQKSTRPKDDAYPEIKFIDSQFICSDCGITCSCVLTKKI